MFSWSCFLTLGVGEERSFEVGIITNWGKGVFSRTKIVTFVPLFQMVNKTPYTLVVTQRPLESLMDNSSGGGGSTGSLNSRDMQNTNSFETSNRRKDKLYSRSNSQQDTNDAYILKCDSGVSTNFHWSPRWDRVLRVRLHDDPFTAWSGCFRIDKETTFHVVIKSSRKEDVILQVNLVGQKKNISNIYSF